MKDVYGKEKMNWNLTEEQEDKIIEAFWDSEDSWDEYVDRFSGEVNLSKDGFMEWIQRISIDDVPDKFIRKYLDKHKQDYGITYRVQARNKESAEIIARRRHPNYVVRRIDVLRKATRDTVGDYRMFLSKPVIERNGMRFRVGLGRTKLLGKVK